MAAPNATSPRTAMVARGLSKSFEATRALDGFSFGVAFGEVHALVGGNGSGKSTFIKILAGIYEADDGELEIGGEIFEVGQYSPDEARRCGLRFVHQDLGIFGMQSVAENLAIGNGFPHGRAGLIDWGETRARARDMLGRFNLDVDPRALAGTLSVPQQAVLAIARALQDVDEDERAILVMDEPTAALPAEEADILIATLRNLASEGHAVIIVTHRIDEVRRVADNVTALRDARSAGTVAASAMSDSQAAQLILGRQIERTQEVGEVVVGGDLVLEAKGIRGGPITNVDLRVAAGEILGIAGLLGSGRSELLRLIYGALPLEGGEVWIDGESIDDPDPHLMSARGVGLVPEDRMADALFGGSPVRENMTAGRVGEYFKGFRMRRRAERHAVAEDLDRYSIKAASTEISIEGLSGGNQQKVVLGRWLRSKPRLLLLDEPTQGVDIGAKEDIFALINRAAAEGSAFIVVSSEFEELVRLCHRVVVLAQGRIVAELSRPMSSHDLLGSVFEAGQSR